MGFACRASSDTILLIVERIKVQVLNKLKNLKLTQVLVFCLKYLQS